MSKQPDPKPPHRELSRTRLLEELRALASRTGDIAHDLNNMLGTIMGYGAVVLDDLAADDPNREFMAKMIEAGAEAERLVAELLDTARDENVRAVREDLSRAA